MKKEKDNMKSVIFWDTLSDFDRNWRTVLRIFVMRFAYIMVHVHVRKHPDEIMQGIEIAYRLIYGARPDGVQSMPTWEWWPGWSLRTHIYPLWLALPGLILKAVSLDTNFLLVNSVYFMHCLIWTVGDIFMLKFMTQLLGKKEAIFCLIMSFTSEYVNDYVLRTSSNGIEGNIMFASFYFFMNIKPQIFDRSTLYMTFAITISFIIRSSSIIGYLPLALVKIY